MILDAPVAFALSMMVVGAVIYGGIEYIHRARVAALEATIRLKETTISDLERQLKASALAAPGASIGSGSEPNTLESALRIVFRREPSFFPEVEYAPVGITRRMLQVIVRNEGNGWLSNCRLEVISIAPPPIYTESPYAKGALEPAFGLNYKAQRIVTIAAFNRIPIANDVSMPFNEGPTIFHSAPGTWGGGAHVVLSRDSRSTLRLRAVCDECKPHEIDLRLWVDENRALQAEMS